MVLKMVKMVLQKVEDDSWRRLNIILKNVDDGLEGG